jgi:hypothetical protein
MASPSATRRQDSVSAATSAIRLQNELLSSISSRPVSVRPLSLPEPSYSWNSIIISRHRSENHLDRRPQASYDTQNHLSGRDYDGHGTLTFSHDHTYSDNSAYLPPVLLDEAEPQVPLMQTTTNRQSISSYHPGTVTISFSANMHVSSEDEVDPVEEAMLGHVLSKGRALSLAELDGAHFS